MTAKSSEYLPGEFWLDPVELDEVCGDGVDELVAKNLKIKDYLQKRPDNMNSFNLLFTLSGLLRFIFHFKREKYLSSLLVSFVNLMNQYGVVLSGTFFLRWNRTECWDIDLEETARPGRGQTMPGEGVLCKSLGRGVLLGPNTRS